MERSVSKEQHVVEAAQQTAAAGDAASVSASAAGDLQPELAFQNEILQGVSRTFALTIPELPEDLRDVVGNAYLLCRIADTIEDAVALSVEEKGEFGDAFVRCVAGEAAPEAFAEALTPRLGVGTLDAERELVARTPEVLRLTHSFSRQDQQAMLRCVRIMVEGMELFQEGQFSDGLEDEEHLSRYCYHVAGVVGEMLTDLFCAHRPAIAAVRSELEPRAVAFGQGLQMTNILKDIWDDKTRKVCWLPQSTFSEAGFDLHDLKKGERHPAFEEGLGQVIGVARCHLETALEYTLRIPPSEQGIRNFCLWALGMAVLTLRKINSRRDFQSGQEVKISRKSVHATVLYTRLFGKSNRSLRLIFKALAAGLPRQAACPR
jgi:farnesyl-diphosphate farnesyltransferase